MSKQKRIIAIVLALSVIFSGFSLDTQVGDFRRTAEGYAEIVVRYLKSVFEPRTYSDYNELCKIPETENGYIPQGYCFSQKYNIHFISYYHSSLCSIITLVDASSGEKIKTVTLEKNGKAFTGHAGGVAEDGKYFYLSDGNGFYRLPLKELIETNDGEPLVLKDKILTDVKCSYLNCDGEYIYAGEFYTFTSDGKYDTDKAHHKAISAFETSYSFCNAYSVSDLENYNFNGGELAVPKMIFATPNCVQGFARNAQGNYVLSISYGRNNNSSLAFYENVACEESDFDVKYGSETVPAYYLDDSSKKANLRQPPLLEGIDDMNGKITGIFESCAEKYSDSAFIVDSICNFE